MDEIDNEIRPCARDAEESSDLEHSFETPARGRDWERKVSGFKDIGLSKHQESRASTTRWVQNDEGCMQVHLDSGKVP